MRCWKCGQNMPDGLKYCGNCGVHMNRAVHFVRWLFSRKGLPVLLIIASLICGGAALGIYLNMDSADTDVDFEALLRQEAFPETDAMSSALNDAVVFSGMKAGEDTVVFTLSAPDIAPELIAWYESRERFSGDELEAKILELLRTEKTEAEFTLGYTVDADGSVIIHYTGEYLSHMSCGLREFYDYLYEQVMGGGA